MFPDRADFGRSDLLRRARERSNALISTKNQIFQEQAKFRYECQTFKNVNESWLNVEKSIKQPTNQKNQPTNQPTNQPNNQPTNQTPNQKKLKKGETI